MSSAPDGDETQITKEGVSYKNVGHGRGEQDLAASYEHLCKLRDGGFDGHHPARGE